MSIFISVIFIILAYFVHECFGHAVAMKRSGVAVKQIGFGLPFGPKITFPMKGKWLGTDFVLYYLCPFGAFTACDEDGMTRLPFWEKSRFFVSGPIASIIFGYFLFIISGFIVMIENGMTRYPNNHLLIISCLTVAVLLIALKFGGKIFYTYIVPLIPVFLFLFAFYSLFFSQNATVVTTVSLVHTAGKISELSGAFFFAGAFSINFFGVSMMLPLRFFGIPLDGEQITLSIINKFMPKMVSFFISVETLIFGLLLLYALQTDLKPILLPFIAGLLH